MNIQSEKQSDGTWKAFVEEDSRICVGGFTQSEAVGKALCMYANKVCAPTVEAMRISESKSNYGEFIKAPNE